MDYVVKNGGTQALNDVTVRSDSDFEFEHGVLIAEAHSSFSGTMTLRAENKLTISWTRDGGVLEERTLVVTSDVLKDERVRVFTISAADEVQAGWKWGD